MREGGVLVHFLKTINVLAITTKMQSNELNDCLDLISVLYTIDITEFYDVTTGALRFCIVQKLHLSSFTSIFDPTETFNLG